MFKNFLNLRKNIVSFQGKIEFVTYMSAFVLFSLHLFYLGFYVYEKIYPMIFFDIIGVIIFAYYLYRGIKDHDLFSLVCYFSILIHTVLAILCLGWTPGYYLWLYALVCAFFLPSFGKLESDSIRRPLFYGVCYVLLYFILGFLIPSGFLKPFYNIHKLTAVVLFGVNSAVTFLTIITFTYFYTTRQIVKENNLKHLADYDQLTNLRNRNAINKLIDYRVNNQNEEFSLAILDIDFFKNVNDTYGHNAGDIVLKGVANKISQLEDFGIISGRWGGEEFIILGPADMGHKQFIDIMEGFRRNIRESKFNYARSVIKITVSIGVNRHVKEATIKDTIEEADKHLYQAKESGRNKVIH